MKSETAAGSTPEDRFQTAVEGALLLLLAALFLPSGTGEFAAVAAAGALLLLLNAGRLLAGIRPHWFSVTVGAWAVACGSFALAGIVLNDIAVFFLLLGLILLGAAALQGRGTMGLERRRHARG
jgi:hypothetical protein